MCYKYVMDKIKDNGCDYCGQEIELGSKYWKRFCSGKCRDRWHGRLRKDAMKKFLEEKYGKR